MSDQRLNPDTLLQQVTQEEEQAKKGKLKIYLGAAPGVGKTHEMLHDALEMRSKGLDVVVGIVESHGRQEIQMLLKNFEMIPRKEINYHGKNLLEFDITTALKRHPGLIILDEMAHQNVPGSRHKKRWQDIKELLERGIDVYTTLNVQHIEGLSDDVTQIIHAPIKEIVPDYMIEMADTIELVDIPPEELLKRLQEGKIYFPDQAKLAAQHFFRKGNLIALRELALRATAKYVGSQVLLYRQGQGIQHIWPTREKILVCVGAGSEAVKLLRTARRMANNLQADWIAVYVDSPKIGISEKRRAQVIRNLQVAEQLGARTQILSGFDVVKEIMNYARQQNVTQIMIWKYVRNRWHSVFFKSLADEIVRHSQEIDVYIMTGALENEETVKINHNQTISWQSYGYAFLMVAIATALNFLLSPYLSTSSLMMVYLLGVTIIALLGQTGPALIVSILSVLAYDFFFIKPYYSFAISDIEYIFTLIVMLMVSQVISQLVITSKRQAKSAHFIQNQTSTLYNLSRQLSETRGLDNLLRVGIEYIAKLFNCQVDALIPQDNKLYIRAKYGNQHPLTEKEMSVAQWVFELGQKAGFGTETLSFSEALYLPLLGTKKVIGVLRIYPEKPDELLSLDNTHLLEICTSQIALAVEVDRVLGKKS